MSDMQQELALAHAVVERQGKEIERLRAAYEAVAAERRALEADGLKLRAALREVRDTEANLPDPSTPWALIRKLKSIAREALNETSVRHRD